MYGEREKKVAVRSVSFGVGAGECFGLLGVNGAGKSSLFRCLAGYQAPTSGDALIKGFSIFKDSNKVTRPISQHQPSIVHSNLPFRWLVT